MGKRELQRVILNFYQMNFHFFCFKGQIEPLLLNLQIHINTITICLCEENAQSNSFDHKVALATSIVIISKSNFAEYFCVYETDKKLIGIPASNFLQPSRSFIS